jgi:hypothetical protein
VLDRGKQLLVFFVKRAPHGICGVSNTVSSRPVPVPSPTETTGIPEISLHLHSPAISLELPLTLTTGTPSYSAELKTFTGDQTLMTQNFLQPTRIENGLIVEIVVPVDLLKVGTYYTVHLHSSDRTDRFTFKVVDRQ